jgi:AcrR family transcriptional regulator
MEKEPGTAAALLAAGRELFAERGYEGASVRAITSHACANLGAITYHFGSKRELYDRVVEGCVLPLVERVESIAGLGAVDGAARSALDRVEEVVHAFYDHLRSHPELPRLLMQELAVGQGPPPAAVGPIRRMHKALVAIVREGQAAGEIRRDNPLVLVVSVVAQPIHFGLVGRASMALTGQDPDDPVRWRELVRNAVTFVRGGLAAGPGVGGQ